MLLYLASIIVTVSVKGLTKLLNGRIASELFDLEQLCSVNRHVVTDTKLKTLDFKLQHLAMFES